MPQPLPLLRHFHSLKDPRVNRRKMHSLENILVISLCAVLAGAQDFLQSATFGQEKRAWLERFLDLSNGIPSHDPLERDV